MMLITMDTPLKFTAKGGRSYAGRNMQWPMPSGDVPGDWVRQYKLKPVLCKMGYHWCYARHAVEHMHQELWLFEPAGITVEGPDKNASQGGRLLRRVETWNATTQRLFAADCAEDVAHIAGEHEATYRATIAVVRRYARGEATDAELDAAWAAAWDAAWDAAWAAAWAAAWDAASAAARATQTTRLLKYLNGELQ